MRGAPRLPAPHRPPLPPPPHTSSPRACSYFVTPFARFHPGGIPDLMKAAGVDGSEMFSK
jgi:hypothetical protein